MWPVSHHHHHNGKANRIEFTKTTSHPVLERIGRRDKEKHSWQEWKPQKDPLSFLPSKQINSYHVYMSARKWACSTISCNAEQRINLDHPLQFVFKTRTHFLSLYNFNHNFWAKTTRNYCFKSACLLDSTLYWILPCFSRLPQY